MLKGESISDIINICGCYSVSTDTLICLELAQQEFPYLNVLM